MRQLIKGGATFIRTLSGVGVDDRLTPVENPYVCQPTLHYPGFPQDKRQLASQCSVEIMSLCQLCQNFDLQSFSWDSDGLRGYEVEAMRAGEEAGCDLCILLAQNLPPVLNGTWIHFELLQDNTRCASRKEKTPLRANRLSVAVGDRIIEKINKAQQATFRLAADPSELHHFATRNRLQEVRIRISHVRIAELTWDRITSSTESRHCWKVSW